MHIINVELYIFIFIVVLEDLKNSFEKLDIRVGLLEGKSSTVSIYLILN